MQWNPSYDFRLFDIGWVSPLQANEFGAATSFRASDPTSFVDYSLNQLAGLLDPRAAYSYAQRQLPAPIEDVPVIPFFQGRGRAQTRAEIEAEVARRQAEFERAKAEAKAPRQCPPGYRPVSVFGLFSYCGKELKSDGEGTMGDDPARSGAKMAALAEWWNTLPQGAGVFLIGLAALIFIFLFIARR
jgi:hypothetical protein